MCKEEPQLYKQCWYEEKKDYILQKAKEHYEENKEQKIEYQKQYAKENSEIICEKKAKATKKDLHYRFWTHKEWEKFYKDQIATAHKLLKKYTISEWKTYLKWDLINSYSSFLNKNTYYAQLTNPILVSMHTSYWMSIVATVDNSLNLNHTATWGWGVSQTTPFSPFPPYEPVIAYYSNNNGPLYSMSANMSFSISGIAVPEPPGLIALGLGLICIFLMKLSQEAES